MICTIGIAGNDGLVSVAGVVHGFPGSPGLPPQGWGIHSAG